MAPSQDDLVTGVQELAPSFTAGPASLTPENLYLNQDPAARVRTLPLIYRRLCGAADRTEPL